jgi:hypothetical protein
MPLQLTSFFEIDQGPRTIGWSETVVTVDSSLTGAASQGSPTAAYLAARLNLLGAGAINTFNRYALTLPNGRPLVPIPRRAVLSQVGTVPSYTTAGLPYYNPNFATQLADFCQTDWLLRWYTALGAQPTYFRSFWLAGLPDNFTNIELYSPLGLNWSAAFNAWQAAIKGYILIRVNDRSNANPAILCTTFTNTVPCAYTVPAHGFNQGNLIEAVGWRAAAGGTVPRGRYRVSVIDANTIALQGHTAPPTGVSTFGAFRAISYQYPAVTGMVAKGWTNHKRGRPTELLAGRRRTATREAI